MNFRVGAYLQRTALRAKHLTGLDASIGYTFLARGMSILGSTGTVILIVRYLSAVEQGYYYALLSLVSLQSVFEMGFSFVIQQLAAHECVQLTIAQDGSINGNGAAHSRLASILKMSLRWYSVAAIAMGLILLPCGELFFSTHHGSTQVQWQAPWLCCVGASMIGLWCMPLYSLLEGAGQVRSVAAMRVWQALVAILLAWPAMLLKHGLFSPALVITAQSAVGLLFIFTRGRFLTKLFAHPVFDAAIDWGREIWPFQWRIAFSWMCSYFTLQIFIPIIFMLRGATDAGKMGMSISVTGYMTVLALAWTSTKATPFGRLVARREFKILDQLFLRTLVQSLIVLGIIALFAVACVAVMPSISPSLAKRMLSPWLFGILVLAAIANHVIQSLAILLRSFKEEPFLWQSLTVALLTVSFALATAGRLGNLGAALSYLVATGFIGLPAALFIFVRKRRSYLLGSGSVAAAATATVMHMHSEAG